MSNSVRPQRRQPTRLPRPWDSPGKNTGVGCRFLLQCMRVKSESEVAQSCLTLSDPMDCSPPGSSVHGICQARVLEWGAIAFSGIHRLLKGKFNLWGRNKLFPLYGGSQVALVERTCLTMREMYEMQVRSLGQEVPLRREWQPTLLFLPRESHGQRNLLGYSPWD